VGGLGEEAVKGLRPGRRIVGLCVTAWGAVRVMAAFCLRLIACLQAPRSPKIRY
jgi:hypothetical protein